MVTVRGPDEPTASELPETVRISTVVMSRAVLDSHFLRTVEHLDSRRFFLCAPLHSILIRCANECAEQRMWLEWLRLELRMELAADEMRMVRQFDHLHVGPARSGSGNTQSCRRHGFFVLAIEFVAMPVTFADLRLPVNLVRERAGLDLARPRAQPHRSAEFLYAAQLAQLVDHSMRRRGIKFARIRLRQSHNISSKLNACRLHAEANTEIRHLLLARIPDRLQHSFDSTLAEATRHQNSVIPFKLRLEAVSFCSFQALGLDPVDLQLQVVREGSVHQRLF